VDTLNGTIPLTPPTPQPVCDGHKRHHHHHGGQAQWPDAAQKGTTGSLHALNQAGRAETAPPATKDAVDLERKRLFEAECERFPKRVHVFLDGDSYYNIERNDAAKMLGYFTGKLQADGFPWELKKNVKVGPITIPREVSEMEALQMLQRGEEVLFQPKRIINISVSPDSVASLALLGTPLAPAAVATSLSKVNVKADGAGRELNYGKAVAIHNFGELKLLYEMYNPDAQGQGDALGDISKKVSFFSMKMHNTDYPWTFYRADPGSRWSNTLKETGQGAVLGALGGAAIGLILSTASAGKISLLDSTLCAAQLGAIGYGIFSGLRQLFVPRSTVEINTLETLDRITKGDPVIFQKRKMHNISLFIISKLTWFTDYGVGSEIRGKGDLDVFYAMQNQWPDKKKDDKGTDTDNT